MLILEFQLSEFKTNGRTQNFVYQQYSGHLPCYCWKFGSTIDKSVLVLCVHSTMYAKYIKVSGINTIIYAYIYTIHYTCTYYIAMPNKKLLFLNSAKVIFYKRIQVIARFCSNSLWKHIQ